MLELKGIKKDYAAGENIAAGYGNAASVMDGWMNSPGHRANILGSSYNKVGIGYYYDANSTYRYYWVQIFAGTQQDWYLKECFDKQDLRKRFACLPNPLYDWQNIYSEFPGYLPA